MGANLNGAIRLRCAIIDSVTNLVEQYADDVIFLEDPSVKAIRRPRRFGLI